MILFKKNDLEKFIAGKKATCRKSDWHQAKAGGKSYQLRINFNYPPFAFADVKSMEKINLEDLTSFKDLGCSNLEDYLKTYGGCSNESNLNRMYVEFENIILNPEFPWKEFGFEGVF